MFSMQDESRPATAVPADLDFCAARHDCLNPKGRSMLNAVNFTSASEFRRRTFPVHRLVMTTVAVFMIAAPRACATNDWFKEEILHETAGIGDERAGVTVLDVDGDNKLDILSTEMGGTLVAYPQADDYKPQTIIEQWPKWQGSTETRVVVGASPNRDRLFAVVSPMRNAAAVAATRIFRLLPPNTTRSHWQLKQVTSMAEPPEHVCLWRIGPEQWRLFTIEHDGRARDVVEYAPPNSAKASWRRNVIIKDVGEIADWIPRDFESTATTNHQNKDVKHPRLHLVGRDGWIHITPTSDPDWKVQRVAYPDAGKLQPSTNAEDQPRNQPFQNAVVVTMGELSPNRRVFASVEDEGLPFVPHVPRGNVLVAAVEANANSQRSLTVQTLLDERHERGHKMANVQGADLLAIGRDQIIVDTDVGLAVFVPADDRGREWRRINLAGQHPFVIADLNSDDKPDIVCREPRTVTVLWNRTPDEIPTQWTVVNNGKHDTMRGFLSPESGVKAIRDMLRNKQWAQLAEYYVLDDSQINRATLESGEFFFDPRRVRDVREAR